PSGHLADRRDRRQVILAGIGAELAAGLVLFALAAAERLTVFAILALALVFGIARAVSTPAARAIMPNLMPKQDFAGAVAWSSSSWQIATICGPGLGGLLYAWSPAVAYGGAAPGLAGGVPAPAPERGPHGARARGPRARPPRPRAP